MLSPAVFKAYDVRGIVPDELDADGAYALARGVRGRVRAAGDGDRPRHAAVVARDRRRRHRAAPSEAGADVVDLGQIGTEMLYFAVGEYGYEGGLQVTASHNPAAYNGMKIVRRGALPVGSRHRPRQDQGARARRAAGTGRDGRRGVAARRLRRVPRPGVGSSSTPSAVRPLCDRARRLQRHGRPDDRAGARSRCRCARPTHNFEPDGHFPNHEPNPLLEENRRFIIERVRSEGADLGIAWDGDADRCFFIDDTGEFVPGDLITALIARTMLERHPGATIVYDLRASWAVRDVVREAGGTALENRVGHAFIKARIRKEDAVFAGEVSGHYYFRDFYYCDTGVVPALVLIELVSRAGKPLSELLRPVPREVLHLGRDQLDRVRRPGQAAAAEGALRPGGRPGVAPGRDLVRVRATGTSTCARRTPSRSCA